MEKDILGNELQNSNKRYSNCQTFAFVDQDGNRLGEAGVNDVCRMNKKTSAIVSDNQRASNANEEYNVGDVMDFLFRTTKNVIFLVVDKLGKEKSYKNGRILGTVNDGNGEPDKVLVEVSN